MSEISNSICHNALIFIRIYYDFWRDKLETNYIGLYTLFLNYSQ
jgi:hypothetical protein